MHEDQEMISTLDSIRDSNPNNILQVMKLRALIERKIDRYAQLERVYLKYKSIFDDIKEIMEEEKK